MFLASENIDFTGLAHVFLLGGGERPLLFEDEVELLTSPFDLAEYKNAIMDSMHKGTKRNIESESDSKNAKVG